MIAKPLDQIVEADIAALVSDKAEEGTRIDFKRELPREDAEGKKALYSDICAFANTSGGDLVFGVDETDGVATGVVPLELPGGVDGYVLKLTNSIRDSIEPRLHGVHIHPVPLAEGGHALVIRVQRSTSGLHRYSKDGHFYVRRSRSNDRLDVPGVVSRVSDMLGREDRVNSFFARRYADILANQHALVMSEGPKLVVHLVPVRDFLSGEERDVWNIPDGAKTAGLAHYHGGTAHNTIDGRAFFCWAPGGKAEVAGAFTLFMHCGVVESCMGLTSASWPPDQQKIDLSWVEHSVLKLVQSFVSSPQLKTTTDLPFLVRVALLGTNGLPFTSGVPNAYWPDGLKVHQRLPVLVLPDALVEAEDADFPHLLHPSFLRMWQAWGFTKSFNYSQKDGRWVRKDR